ncbi:MAG: aminotransferase class IV [Actinobacteria bacterium]|nr:aminotransferase class IV [Actinomycetota bacterium]
MSNEIWLNDRFVPYEEATVPIDDRGFQFSESVYEVIHVYAGHPFEMQRHMRRLKMGLDALGIDLGMSMDELAKKSMEVVHHNGLVDAMVYIQATTGAAPRIHLRPKQLTPTLIIIASPAPPASREWTDSGINCVTMSDGRWSGCYIKTTMLLPNTLAKRKAVASGYSDAIFVRDGYAVESTASNLFAVFDGALWTTPASNYILGGITREVVLELAHEAGIPVREAPIPVDKLFEADELFTTGSGAEIACIASVDGKQIGTGRPGPVIERLREAFRQRTLAQ